MAEHARITQKRYRQHQKGIHDLCPPDRECRSVRLNAPELPAGRIREAVGNYTEQYPTNCASCRVFRALAFKCADAIEDGNSRMNGELRQLTATMEACRSRHAPEGDVYDPVDALIASLEADQ